MPELNERIIIEKYNKGESLSKEEEEFVMGQEHADDSGGDIDESEGDDAFKDLEKEDSEQKDDKSDTGHDEKKEPEEEKEEAAEEGADKEAGADTEKKSEEKKEEEEKVAPEDKGEKKEEKKADDQEDPEAYVARMEAMARGDIPEDTSKFSKNEKALYWEMKKAHFHKKQAQEELNRYKFREIKRKHDEEARESESEKEDDEELMTRGEFRKKLKEERDRIKAESDQQTRSFLLSSWYREGAKSCGNDFEKVMGIAEPIMAKNDAYKAEVFERVKKGENPAVVIYGLVKGDPSFARLYALTYPDDKPKEEKKDEKKDEGISKENLEKNKKLNDNLKKPNTSGQKGGGSGSPEGEPTLAEIAAMTEAEFEKLPKQTQDKFLEKYG